MLWQQTWITAVRCAFLAAHAVWLDQHTYQVPVVNQDGDVVQ